MWAMEPKSITERQMGYEAPKILDLGDLVEITEAASTGNFLDRAFPAGTPKNELTFSG
jgi:hypothetical protein